jgi:hypothetical protein
MTDAPTRTCLTALAKGVTQLKTLNIEVPHSLGRESAKQRMQMLVQRWERKYGVRSTWEGDAARLDGKVLGITLQATLEVEESSVRGQASDPGVLFRHKAKRYLEEKLALYLDPSKTPEAIEKADS